VSVLHLFILMTHRFPSDPDRKQLWVQNIRRDDWVPSTHTRICSDHFLEKCINRTGQRTELKVSAIPTRFKKFPEIYKMVKK
jgi:hypothetical protein